MRNWVREAEVAGTRWAASGVEAERLKRESIGASDQRIQELEQENTRLKRIVADKELDIEALREDGQRFLANPLS